MSKISVIMPAYNVEKYVAGAIKSVLNQTFRDIELIVINDGSRDKTSEIIRDLADSDNRIVFIDNKKNSGAANSRNMGIDIATGDWFYFMDADDTLDSDAFEFLLNLDGANDADIIIFKKHGEKTTSCVWHLESPVSINVTDPGPMTKLYKRKLILDNGLRYQSLSSCNDVFFTLMAVSCAKSVIKVDKSFYHYNLSNPFSISSNRASKAHNLFVAFGAIKAEMEKRGTFQYYEPQFNKAFASCARYELSNMDNLVQQSEFTSRLSQLFPAVYKKLFRFGKLLYKARFRNGQRDIHLFGIKIFSYSRRPKIKLPHINKQKLNLKIEAFDSIGTDTNSGRNPRIIVSLTSFPPRISEIHFTIYSLLTQTLKPDMVVLWLGADEFPNREKDLPNSLLKLCDNGLTIKWCKDIKSYTKLIPALKEYSDDIIITVDDDVFYMRDVVEKLYNAYLKNPKYIHCLRAHRVEFDINGNIRPYNSWPKCIQNVKPSYANFFTGVGGVLYPPHIFNEEIFNEQTFMDLAPRADDVWFWAMAIINHVKVNVVKSHFRIISVSPERDLGLNGEPTLWALNKLSDGNDPQISAVMNHYHITKKHIED